jgi:phosphoglycerate dehydrogenase-like enzyme
MTADVIARADRLKVVGRAGVGVDNVDVPAATKRGIIVANAPQSNIVTAAEHTVALLLALARNIPRAHASLIDGRWERSKLNGVEVYEKTLGVLGFGRIGQLVAARARASACESSPSIRTSARSATASSASRRPIRAPTSTPARTSSRSTCRARPRPAGG